MTDKQKKYLFITAGVLLFLGIGAWAVWYFGFRNKTDKPADSPAKTPGADVPVKTASKGNDAFPLKQGSVGDHVKKVQLAINIINGNKDLAEDGVLGGITYKSILTTLGTNYYPVTQEIYNNILEEATVLTKK